MKRLCLFAFLLAAAVSLAPVDAKTKTYLCDASPRQAAVGVAAGAAVSTTADRANSECRFSVNGEPVGSPPRDLVINAYNVLRSGQALQRIQSGDVDVLAFALLASSPLREVPNNLVGLLRRYREGLVRCFVSLGEGKTVVRIVSDQNLFCSIFAPTSDGVTVGFGNNNTIRIQPTTPNDPPQLVLGYAADKLETFLFVPLSYISGSLPPLR
jgi:hypothetical protein